MSDYREKFKNVTRFVQHHTGILMMVANQACHEYYYIERNILKKSCVLSFLNY